MKSPEIEGELCLVAAVSQLPSHGEAVSVVAFLCFFVAGRRRAVEKVEVMRPMLDTVAQHVDGAALADLALQP